MYLYDIWNTMKQSVSDGLTRTGELPGGLEVERKAQYLYNRRHIDESPQTRENRLVCAYAFAVAEQNASGGEIVTAPTCGASGVMPAALLYMQEERGFSDEAIVRALAAGGVIGDLIKTNASISGAECGCQAEIGSACSMTAAALGELFEMGLGQIGYAAEVAMEHHLGLTCDPIGGLVQIPCIERNAVAAMRAINALSLANFLSETSKISFDTVVHTMYETGRDLNRVYRETAERKITILKNKSRPPAQPVVLALPFFCGKRFQKSSFVRRQKNAVRRRLAGVAEPGTEFLRVLRIFLPDPDGIRPLSRVERVVHLQTVERDAVHTGQPRRKSGVPVIAHKHPRVSRQRKNLPSAGKRFQLFHDPDRRRVFLCGGWVGNNPFLRSLCNVFRLKGDPVLISLLTYHVFISQKRRSANLQKRQRGKSRR